MSKTKKTKYLISLLLFLAIAIIITPVFASDDTVDPAVLSFSLKAGETAAEHYTYVNNSDKDEEIAIEIKAFEPTDGDHGTSFTTALGMPVISPLTTWIKFDQTSYAVKANSSLGIDFTVNTPSDAKEGKYFTALFNNLNDGTVNSEGTSIQKQLGVRLVVEVRGKQPASPLLNSKEKNNNIAGLCVGIFALILVILALLVAYIKKTIFKKKKKISNTNLVKPKTKRRKHV